MPASCFDAGQAEVGDPEFAVVVEQQVGRLDVAVEDAVLVGVVEGLGRLDAEAGDRAVVFAGVERRESLKRRRCRWCRTVGSAALAVSAAVGCLMESAAGASFLVRRRTTGFHVRDDLGQAIGPR